MGINGGVVPLALLSTALLLGGVSAIILTRKIARARLMREYERAARAQQEAERLAKAKPELVDVYIQLPQKEFVLNRDALPWTHVLVRAFDPSCDPYSDAELHNAFDSPYPLPRSRRCVVRILTALYSTGQATRSTRSLTEMCWASRWASRCRDPHRETTWI